MVSDNLIWERLENLDQKIDKILECTSRNEEHLKQINGNIERHEKKICDNEKRIRKIELNLRYYIGMGTGLIILIGLILGILEAIF